LKNPNQSSDGSPISAEDHAQEIVRAAHAELKSLLKQRVDLMKRIGTIKLTISSLANLYGPSILNAELEELLDRKPRENLPGITGACRKVLMEARKPVVARQVVAELEKRDPKVLANQRNPVASVTTILNRLAAYGEARTLAEADGRRMWEWVAQEGIS
jgi:hypothetical protein